MFRGAGNHGLSPGQPLPLGRLSRGHVNDWAVVGAGVVASSVGVTLLVCGFLLARGRSKAGPMWEASSYWREGADEDVVMAVGGSSEEDEGTLTESEERSSFKSLLIV